MSRVNAEPVDQTTEQYRQLIRQNRDFAARMIAALRSGAETAAGMTATVRTTKDTQRGFVEHSDSTQVAS
jgi:ADP-dependent phosphofructokinase/glucokinase